MAELRRWMPEEERAALNKIGNRFDALPKNAKVSETPTEEAGDATSDEELSETERRMLQALGYVE